MNAHEYILSKQIQWAHNNNIKRDGELVFADPYHHLTFEEKRKTRE